MIQPRSFDRGFFYGVGINHAYGLISLVRIFSFANRLDMAGLNAVFSH